MSPAPVDLCWAQGQPGTDSPRCAGRRGEFRVLPAAAAAEALSVTVGSPCKDPMAPALLESAAGAGTSGAADCIGGAAGNAAGDTFWLRA